MWSIALLIVVINVPLCADDPVAQTPAGTVTEPVADQTSSPGEQVGEPATSALPEPVETPTVPPSGTRPSFSSPVSAVGPTEADFEEARRIRDEINAFILATTASIEHAGERQTATEEELGELAGQLDSVVPGTEDADRLHELIVERLTESRRELRTVLDELSEPSGAPSISRSENLSGRTNGPTWKKWTSLVDDNRALRADALKMEDRLRWTNVALAGSKFHGLSALRRASFEKISLGKRDRIFGTSREGFEQLAREWTHVALATRYYAAVRAHDILLAPEAASDYFALGEFLIAFLRLVLVLAVAFFVKKRWRGWIHDVRGPLFRWFRTINARRRLERILGLIEISFQWLLLFATIYLAEWALGSHLQAIELKLAFTLLYYYGMYRLAIDLVVAGALRMATHYELEISGERETLIRTSAVSFFRVILGLALLNLLSGSMLGGGYLSQIAARFAAVVVAITLLVLMLHWRRELADAFLSKHSEGKIAELVRNTRDTWIGVFVAPASFVWILGRALAVLARDFAMGFEQTQRALAFLFRRRIEKQAERRGYAAGDLDVLPEKCLEAFSEDAIDRGPGVIDHFPGIEDLRSDLSIWRDRQEGRSMLLTGQRGVGKTSWLRQIRRDDVQVDRIGLGMRTTSGSHLCQLLADRLGCPDATLEGLVRHLSEGEPRVVVFDDAQHLFLATVGGYEAWATFTELINRTKRRVFWVVAMSAYAWKHLKAVRNDWTVFSRHEHLSAWNEERIRELLHARAKASGLHYNLSGLVLESLEGVSTRDHLIESAEGYARLLWDYADGNPRVALHFFLRSLDRESENRMRVRLFRAPDVEKLEEMGEIAMFMMSCIVEHESISAAHIAEGTRYPIEICRIHLDKFVAKGITREDDGLYRVTTHWHRAVVRTLRRHNILTV